MLSLSAVNSEPFFHPSFSILTQHVDLLCIELSPLFSFAFYRITFRFFFLLLLMFGLPSILCCILDLALLLRCLLASCMRSFRQLPPVCGRQEEEEEQQLTFGGGDVPRCINKVGDLHNVGDSKVW